MEQNLKFFTKLLVVTFMGVASFIALGNAEPWAGDWVTPVWICSAFFFPFLFGMAVGKPISGRKSALAGSLIGLIVVVVPGYLYMATGDRGYTEHAMQNFYIAFIPLSIIQGSITAPVGVAARVSIQK